MPPDDSKNEAQTAQASAGGKDAIATVVLAIGAPAAEPAPLLTVLNALPANLGAAVVISLQNREALDEAAFRTSLGARAAALAAITDGASIEAGRIYLPSPDQIVTVAEGRFQVRPAEQIPGRRGTIDSLFVSLAQHQHGRVLGLVMEGTGGDGSLGVTAIKEAGGLTFAEGGSDTAATDLAASNHPAALADIVLPASALPGRIALHVGDLAQRQEQAAAEVRAADADLLSRIAVILRDKTGHDFHGYRRPTFLRRVQRRMQVVQAPSISAYLDTLRARPDEPQQLFNDLLIGVTRFFRDHREFEFLERVIVPKLFEGKGRGSQLRVWVLGCSTGEEAYSIGILLREYAAGMELPPQIQIFATDIDGRALAVARVGRYTQSIAKDLTPQRLARWFVKEGDTYCVVRELREICIFSQHSVIRDTPFSRIDLVSCRNLLIYLDTELQDRVIPLFHFALRPSGILFLGNSENASRHANLFEPVDRSFRIFRRIETPRRILPDFKFSTSDPRFEDIAAPLRPRPAEMSIVRRAERLAERHAPAYAIVDERFEVLHFSARMGRYIHPAGGVPSLNLLNLVHADLRMELRAALSTAVTETRIARADGLQMGQNGSSVVVDLVVEPIHAPPNAQRSFVVIFKDGATIPEAGGDESGTPSLARDEQVRRLRAELRVSRERLQATIETLESTNEELKASNEEYQSLNEELQSANEELATSKEELQSVNEELTTVNGELAHRIDELGRVNSDLKNLLENTQIATVFLSNELHVMNFTPAAAEVFHLVETDIGRSIGHIKPRVVYDELQDDVRRVVRTLGTVERGVENPVTGAHYMVRVLPYRSVDNFIAGAVVTFTDITQLTRAERALRASEERLQLVTGHIPQFVWTAGDSGRWTWTSRQWREYTGRSEEDSRGLGWLECVHPDDQDSVRAAWQAAAEQGILDVEYRIRSADGSWRWFHSRATPLTHGPGDGAVEWFGTSTDVHDMRELRDRQGVLVAELQHRTRNLIAVVRSLATRTLETSTSLEDFQGRFRARLEALARVNGLLSRLEEGDRITFDGLIRAELSAHGAVETGGDGAKVALHGPEGIRLRSATVQTLALGLHEMATNAVKYGALSRPEGRLQIRWHLVDGLDGARQLRVEWRESGLDLGQQQGAPPRRGYGRELIEQALPYQLKAETRFEIGPDGVRWTIDLPVSTQSGGIHA